MFDKGFWGELFDSYGNGKLDTFSQASDFVAFVSLVEDDKESEINTDFDDLI